MQRLFSRAVAAPVLPYRSTTPISPLKERAAVAPISKSLFPSSLPFSSSPQQFKMPSPPTNLAHAPNLPSTKPLCAVGKVSVPVPDSQDGSVPGILHIPSHPRPTQKAAAILLSGAGGGVTGPSAMYISMGDKLTSPSTGHGIPVLRLDYRFPARNRYCVSDTVAAMDYLEQRFAISRFVLVGWSFGGAPVFSAAAKEPKRVIGCATVASQTAETDGIRKLAPRPVLLLHGAADTTLSPTCSRSLFNAYGPVGDRVMKIFEGDDHALTRHAAEAERLLCDFVVKCAGEVEGEGNANYGQDVMGNERVRKELMEKGGDLEGESLR